MTDAFRALHHADQPLLLPNAWDHASAAALVQAGFGAIGTTSLGVAAAHGIPDGQNAAGPETLALAGRLSHLPCLLTVDIEGGFGGGPDQVAEYAAALVAAGAAGINLEDGRADGSLVPVAEQCALIAAIKARVPDLFVNARTDVYWLAGDRGARRARGAGQGGGVPGGRCGRDLRAGRRRGRPRERAGRRHRRAAERALPAGEADRCNSSPSWAYDESAWDLCSSGTALHTAVETALSMAPGRADHGQHPQLRGGPAAQREVSRDRPPPPSRFGRHFHGYDREDVAQRPGVGVGGWGGVGVASGGRSRRGRGGAPARGRCG